METTIKETLNFKRFKEDSEAYEKLKKKIVKLIDSSLMFDELKRRKLVCFDWNEMKYKKTAKTNAVSGEKK